MRRIPATIVTGFLGAGKTSLVRHLLTHASGHRLAIVVNEFGELGIDRDLLLAGKCIEVEAAALAAALREAAGPIVLVANEVGLGLVPETPLGRRFRDEAGRLNQEIAALADRVVFVAAGLPLMLKGG